MARFIAVIHSWHVESKGFQVHELEAKDQKSADGAGALLAIRQQGACCNSTFHILEIADREFLMPRRLTWRERLTGMLEVKL